jgi:hypothetical protein
MIIWLAGLDIFLPLKKVKYKVITKVTPPKSPAGGFLMKSILYKSPYGGFRGRKVSFAMNSH